ncbi:ankyrin repeat and protein kinase domain-containing protein [Anaeramoeba flamelloides]|uniref:Ankyrin repeat and protein kinase domain-containing protein n=1 Tax=Anaeramoeba flamelloides TaxID=1746091 RepID=A0AAV8ADS6_9EUKA|nr:ankyrin repeat and protein kinase domain-containing protein [Anaeramoeba flamelloides]
MSKKKGRKRTEQKHQNKKKRKNNVKRSKQFNQRNKPNDVELEKLLFQELAKPKPCLKRIKIYIQDLEHLNFQNNDSIFPSFGLSPLMVVCRASGDPNLVRLMLDHGSNPNSLSRDDYTASQILCMNDRLTIKEQIESLKLLKSYGGDLNIAKSSQTVLGLLLQREGISLKDLKILTKKLQCSFQIGTSFIDYINCSQEKKVAVLDYMLDQKAHLPFIPTEKKKRKKNVKKKKQNRFVLDLMTSNVPTDYFPRLIESGIEIPPNKILNKKKKEALLHIMCSYRKIRRLDRIQFLINHGSDINALNHKGKSALDLLWKPTTSRILDTINCDQNLECIEYLIEKGIEFDVEKRIGNKNNSPFHYALQEDCVPKVFDFLLGCGVDLNYQNNKKETAFHIACKNRKPNYDIIKSLVNQGANINLKNSQERTGLDYLWHKKCFKTIDFLLSKSATINPNIHKSGSTILHMIIPKIWSNYFHLIEKVIKAGVDINKKNSLNETCFEIAIRDNQDLQMVRFLIKNGSNFEPKKIYFNNETILHQICTNYYTNYHLIHFVIENGCPVNLQNFNGDTFLHILLDRIISHLNFFEILKLIKNLKKNNFRFNIQNRKGKTVLNYFIQKFKILNRRMRLNF